MKKNLTLLTGIVILITILIAGACSPAGTDDDTRNSKRVTIYFKTIEIMGEKHLLMYDSNDTTVKVVDTLCTLVQPGFMVIWAPEEESGIKIIKRIGSSQGEGQIFKKDASKVFLSKRFKLKVPDDASGEEKYDIKFEDKAGEQWNIDPYLRIPDPEEAKEAEGPGGSLP